MGTVTTLMALPAARRRSLEVHYHEHYQWVMRRYAVTLIFVVSRILLAIPGVADRSSAPSACSCILNICALLVPQLVIHRRSMVCAGLQLTRLRGTGVIAESAAVVAAG